MDDEDLANLLRSSTNPGLPGFYSNTNSTTLTPAANAVDDPFANPFANPFASDSDPYQASGSGFGDVSATSNMKSNVEDISPYVTKLREEGVVEESYGFEGQSGNPYAAPSVTTGGFGDDLYSGGFDRNPMPSDPIRGGFDSPGFGVNNSSSSSPFGATSNYANGFAPLQDPFRVAELDDPYSTNRSPKSPPSGSTTRTPTSPARMRPSSDILGLLGEEEDPTASLKKAFVATDARPKVNEDKPNASSGSPRPYVFKPGGNASRKKIGITFDSVQRERERKEKEEKARIEEQTKREAERLKQEELSKSQTTAKPESPVEQETGGASIRATGGEPDDNLEENTLPPGNSILEKAAREAASPVPLAPSVSAVVAAQILESSDPATAAEHVAESMIQHDSPESAQTISSRQDDVTPAQIPLPPSRPITPLSSATALTTPADQTHSVDQINGMEQRPIESSPLDDKQVVSEQNYPALALGGSSYESQTVTEDVSISTERVNRNKGWGRAFEESEDDALTSSRELPTPLAHETLGWTTEVNQPYAGVDSISPEVQESSWTAPDSQRSPDEALVDEVSTTSRADAQTWSPDPAQSPTRNRLLTQPVFTITISDPTRRGDPVRGYIVYTVTTRTTSPHYRRGEFSVLRRFSDFLWLVEAVSNNNPGVIVPPMPDKHAFGRFEEQFVETRRAALERTLGKMANHPVLSLDHDLKLFLSSDAFSVDVKHRRQEMVQEKQGVLASIGGTIGGPRFIEQDDWFTQQKHFLDTLEGQIKGLAKSLEASSKQRLDLATGFGVLSDTLQSLAESDLSLALCQMIHRFSLLGEEERSLQENQAKMDVIRLLNVADEQIRLIGSVRAAFASRIKSFFAWQNADSEARRSKVQYERERVKKGGKYAPEDNNNESAIPDIAQSERRALDARSDFDAVSRLVKLEYARFEQERVEDLKETMERYIDEAIDAQRKTVANWESFQKELSAILTQQRRG